MKLRSPLVFSDGTSQSTAATGGSTISDLKDSCIAASTGNVSLTAPGATMDGVTLVSGNRVFLKDQTAAAQNGIYVWTGSAATLTRATDANTSSLMSDSMIVTVEQGTTNADTSWELVTNNPITVDTTALRFTRVHPAYEIASRPNGLDPFLPTSAILENQTRWNNSFSALSVLTSGTVRIFPLGILRAGQTASSINFAFAAAASGAPTNSWAGIATVSDRVIRAISATSVVNPTANSRTPSFPFAAPYTPDSDAPLYGFVMYQVTTPPTLYGSTQTNAIMISTPTINGNTADTGKTTPMTVGTALGAITAGVNVPYAFLT